MAQSAAEIIDAILVREGSEYSNNPADAGGPTKWGVTLKTLSLYLGRQATEDEVRNMPRDMAVEIYKALYVNPFMYLPEMSPRLLGLLVDSAVQHGVKRAMGWLQSSIGADADGIIGPGTLQRWAPYANATRDVNDVYREVLRTRIRFYAKIIHDNPSQATFANGWFARAVEFI